MKTLTHNVDFGLNNHQLNIVLVGCGGNGAAMLMRLHKIHTSLRALGGYALRVEVFDGDTISESNVGRQPYFSHDIGRPKASTLLSRLKQIDPSIANWHAYDQMLDVDTDAGAWPWMVITCVDTKAARRIVHHRNAMQRFSPYYWLDMGNGAQTGQIVLGECRELQRKHRLPMVTELFAQILDESTLEDNRPSCSAAEALREQSLFINETVVAHAAALLWKMLFEQVVTHPMIYINLEPSSVQSIPIGDPLFKRLGHVTGRHKNPLISEA
jgi:PRTRC genetic system ThiF family protein